MSMLIRSVLGVVMIAYPLVIYFGLLHFQFWQVTLFIAFLAMVRMLLLRKTQTALLKTGFVGAVLLFCFSLVALVLEKAVWLKVYPVAICLLLLFFFASSLYAPKSMIERFAELREKNITLEKKQYMRGLTKVWCGFFVINAAISIYTLFLSDKYWMLYNGLISYLLIGFLIVGELLFRHWVIMKRHV